MDESVLMGNSSIVPTIPVLLTQTDVKANLENVMSLYDPNLMNEILQQYSKVSFWDRINLYLSYFKYIKYVPALLQLIQLIYNLKGIKMTEATLENTINKGVDIGSLVAQFAGLPFTADEITIVKTAIDADFKAYDADLALVAMLETKFGKKA